MDNHQDSHIRLPCSVMLINGFIANISDSAVISSLGSSSLIVYDNNELTVFIGWKKFGNSIEFSNAVVLQLSNPICRRVEVKEIIASKRGEFVILSAKNHACVVRINPEILSSSPHLLDAEYVCESYSLNDSLLFLNRICLEIQLIRILPQKMENMTIAAVLYSDDCLRFYNLNKNRDGHLLDVDFRPYLNNNDENNENCNNTFGLRRHVVSFDFTPFFDLSFSVLAVDSESDFYNVPIYKNCFTESERPEIIPIERPDELPFTPLSLQMIETSDQQISNVFVLLCVGGIVSHLLAVPDEELGCIDLLLHDQLELPINENLDPKIVLGSENSYYLNRYEIVTSKSLYSINISKWADNLLQTNNASNSNLETTVVELANIVESEEIMTTRKMLLKTASISIFTEDDDEDEKEVLHFVVFENNHMMSISKNETKSMTTEDEKKHNESFKIDNSNFEKMMELSGTLPAFVLSDKLTIEEASKTAIEYLKNIEKKIKVHRKLSEIALDKLFDQQTSSKLLTAKNEEIEERLLDETGDVQELRQKAFELKARIENVRKYISVLTSRFDQNAPLTDIEHRMQHRLSEHQHVLSEMSFKIPKLSLEMNEQRRLAQLELLKGNNNKADKFAQIEKNDAEIEHLTSRVEQLHCEL